MNTEFEDHELVSVFSCENDEEADIIVGFLEANGIDAVRNNEVPHSVFPVSSDAHVLVNASDADEARRLIRERGAEVKEGEM